MEGVSQMIREQDAQIGEQNKLLDQEREAQDMRRSRIGEYVQEVAYVDRKDWRPQGGGSDSSDDDTEYTHTEPGQSLEPTNPLTGVRR